MKTAILANQVILSVETTKEDRYHYVTLTPFRKTGSGGVLQTGQSFRIPAAMLDEVADALLSASTEIRSAR